MARLRRLTTVFVLLGLFLPVMPHALGFPHDRGCFDNRVGEGQCLSAALACMGIAGVIRAWVWPRLTPGERRRTWPMVTGLTVAFVLLPIAPMPYWTWDALR